MDELSELVFPILNAARENPDGQSLAQILEKTTEWSADGRIPRHTGGAIIGVALFKLATTNLISLTERSENDIGTQIVSAAQSRDPYSVGYTVAKMLAGKKKTDQCKDDGAFCFSASSAWI